MLKQKNITVEITGMTCDSCAKRIEKAIGTTKGVGEAMVNFATKKATVTSSAPVERQGSATVYVIGEMFGVSLRVVNKAALRVSIQERKQKDLGERIEKIAYSAFKV